MKIPALNLRLTFLVVFVFTFILNAQESAQETSITVRAKAKDAKFIGTSMGGARIIIKDAATGEILAKGITSGSTGNTEKIMKQPRERRQSITDTGTAGFTAQLSIKKPVFVTVEAYGPLNSAGAGVMSSTQLWLLPGKDITGDGLVLEIPGFAVDILSPQTHETVAGEGIIEIKANIVLMCGCPVTDNGLWDANQYELKAVISNDEDKIVKEIPLKTGAKSSTFLAEIELEKGVYEIMVYAFDPATGNTGLDKTHIIVK
ncbi:hypothetical protein [Autumnicola musiva]|uniref:Uncharacterized protein n=1 Tax=Autumnicola musiva TaxID=3075589 RepID=A0ABU3D5I2_9FLAO|nr:hypothetical protein [Zunongwangia sp. F117]MDT0676610.1 hypothetical protein [Zunongwangia sp. F117]